MLGWYSKIKNVQKRRNRNKYRTKTYREMGRVNRSYKVAGATPDYWVSPIDFVPYGIYYTKGRKAYKFAKRATKIAKTGYRAYTKQRSSRESKRFTSAPARKERGGFYYYRGKRYYRSR